MVYSPREYEEGYSCREVYYELGSEDFFLECFCDTVLYPIQSVLKRREITSPLNPASFSYPKPVDKVIVKVSVEGYLPDDLDTDYYDECLSTGNFKLVGKPEVRCDLYSTEGDATGYPGVECSVEFPNGDRFKAVIHVIPDKEGCVIWVKKWEDEPSVWASDCWWECWGKMEAILIDVFYDSPR